MAIISQQIMGYNKYTTKNDRYLFKNYINNAYIRS